QLYDERAWRPSTVQARGIVSGDIDLELCLRTLVSPSVAATGPALAVKLSTEENDAGRRVARTRAGPFLDLGRAPPPPVRANRSGALAGLRREPAGGAARDQPRTPGPGQPARRHRRTRPE